METLKKEKVLFEGVHYCLNGESFEYKVTDSDFERRELTLSMELMKKIQREEVEPSEVIRLLNKIYGDHPMSKRF